MLRRMKHLVTHEQCPATHFLVHTHWCLAPGLPFDLPKRVTPRIKQHFSWELNRQESKTQRLVSQLKLPSSSDRFSVCRVPVWSYVSLVKACCSDPTSLRCSLGDLRSHSWKPLQHCTDMARKNPARSIWDDASALSLTEALHDCRKVTLFLWTSLFNLQNED